MPGETVHVSLVAWKEWVGWQVLLIAFAALQARLPFADVGGTQIGSMLPLCCLALRPVAVCR